MIQVQKWLQTIKISISKQMAYKLNFLLLVIGPSLVFFFVKYNIWSAIFESTDQPVGGYTFETMIQYQIWVLVLALMAQSHNSMALSEDIRLGRISAYLVYPFNFWQFHTASFIGNLVVQGFVVSASILAFASFDFLLGLQLRNLVEGFSLALLVSFLWYTISFTIGILAFWLEETWVFRVMFLTISQFLSGSLIPLEVFPVWLKNISFYTPFPYLTWAPARAFMGELNVPFVQCVGIITFWILCSSLVAKLIWSRGLRMYTAAGM